MNHFNYLYNLYFTISNNTGKVILIYFALKIISENIIQIQTTK